MSSRFFWNLRLRLMDKFTLYQRGVLETRSTALTCRERNALGWPCHVPLPICLQHNGRPGINLRKLHLLFRETVCVRWYIEAFLKARQTVEGRLPRLNTWSNVGLGLERILTFEIMVREDFSLGTNCLTVHREVVDTHILNMFGVLQVSSMVGGWRYESLSWMINRWLVDETIKLEIKYGDYIWRNSRCYLWSLDSEFS